MSEENVRRSIRLKYPHSVRKSEYDETSIYESVDNMVDSVISDSMRYFWDYLVRADRA